MSLASSPDYLLRAEDKAFKTLFPSLEDSATAFDEYLNGEIYDHSDKESNKELSEALTDFLETKESTGSRIGFSPIVAPARHQASSPQPWRTGLWCLNQNVAATPNITITKTRSIPQRRRTSQKRTYDGAGKEAYLNPRSPPATPSSKGTKKFFTPSMTANFNPSLYRQHAFSREVTLSPSPMYAQLQHTGGSAYQDSWQHDFQNFHLRRSEDRLQSPPLSGRILQQQIPTSQLDKTIVTQNGAAIQYHSYQNMYAVNHQQQMAGNGYASLDPALLNSSQIGQAISSQAEEAVYAPQYHAQTNLGLPTWTTESLESSDESQYSFDTLHSLENAQLIKDGHPWQSPALSPNHMPVQQRCNQQCCYYPIIAQPTPHRPTHRLIQQPPPIQAEGLGIHFPSPAALSPATQNSSAVNPMQPYLPLPPPPTYAFTNEDPFSTPHRTRRQSSSLRSPSPCISPTNNTRTLRQRSPTHRTSPTRPRRKSIGTAGPITRTAAPPMPKTPRTPQTPTGHGVMDFVNFTPKDSAKLLSDVAPSGSSKTRARREAEAKERRKRLSEAAVKAVRMAGGDVRVLKAEGLCLS